MANVLFNRGTQANLELKAIQDGSFYLTTDTHRLYVGQGTQKVLLNQTVQFVADITALNAISSAWTDKTGHKNDIYYIEKSASGGNILAVWDGANWVQINPDTNTYITGVANTLSKNTAENSANINVVLTDNGTNSTVSDSILKLANDITFVGDNGILIDVDGSNNVIKLEGDTYTIGTSKDGANAKINLTSTNTDNDSSAVLKPGSNVTINGATDGITITAADTYVDSVGANVSNGTLTVNVSTVNNENASHTTSKQGSVDLYYILGDNTEHYGINGALPVYTKTEVDEKFKKLDGLTYIGTVGQGGTYQLDGTYKVVKNSIIQDVHNGDMFLVAGSEVTYATGKTASPGDLLIATGTENSDGVLTTITWSYVPSGDDDEIDTTYDFIVNQSANSLTIKERGKGSPEGGIISATGDNGSIVVTSTAGTNGNINTLALKVAHAAPGYNESTATQEGYVDSIEAYSDLTISDEGHVTAGTLKTFNISTYKIGSTSFATKQGMETGKTGVVLTPHLYKNNALMDVDPTQNTSVTSSTLKLSANGATEFKIDIEWNEF